MDVDAKRIGLIIQNFRKKSGRSQEVISGLAGLDRTHYSKIERGERIPTLSTLFKIAAALEIAPHEIIMAIENQTQNSDTHVK